MQTDVDAGDLSVFDEDLLAPELVADPYPYYAALRQHDPVHWNPRQNAWLITRYHDVAAAFRDRRFSSERITAFLEEVEPSRRGHVLPVLRPLSYWMVFRDPPAHTRLRSLVAPAFTATALARRSERVAALVDQLLDDFVSRGGTDLLADVAFPLPAIVIAEMLGVPAERREEFGRWSDELALVVAGAVDVAERYERARVGLAGLCELFAELILRYRAAPEENLVSELVNGERARQAPPSAEELSAMCVLLLFAGHETTVNLISTGIVHLLRHPDQLALVRDREELAGPAVEELLRYDGPVKQSMRQIIEDLELHGRRLRAGQRAILVHGAANRDPDRFCDPDRLDVTRSPNPHLAFGHGIHTCVGAPLARMEARIAIPAILQRLPGLALARQELEWNRALLGRSLRRLEVVHDAR